MPLFPSQFPAALDNLPTSYASGQTIPSDWADAVDDAINQMQSFYGLSGVLQVFDLCGKYYGVSTANTATSNQTRIHAAFADAATVGGRVHLRRSASFYPCNPLTLPQAPIWFSGDGPTQSVLLADSGGAASPMLSCNPAGTPTSGPFTPVGGTAAAIYSGNLTIISSLGFNAWNHQVSGVKGISIVNQTGARAQFLLMNLLVIGTWGTGIEIINSGNLWGELLQNCTVTNNTGIAFDLGSDMMVKNCIAANVGLEGFRSLGYGTSLQLEGCKAYGCGGLTAARGIGFYFGSNGAGIAVTNCDAQDNFAEGLVIEDSGSGESHNVVVNGFIADSNSQSSAGTYSGIRLSDCHDVQISGYISTDRNTDFGGGPLLKQSHGLKVTNAAGNNYGNVVEMCQSPTDEGRGFSAMGDPIDAASDLDGTDVKVGGSGGGRKTLAFNATFTPDPYKAQTNYMALTSNVTSIAAPIHKHHGCRLTLMFLASGGTRTIPANASWNAVYKLNGTIPTSGTSGQRLVIEFEYDAANSLWVQMNPASGAPVWF